MTLLTIRQDGHTNGSSDAAGDPNSDVQTSSSQTVGVSAFQLKHSQIVASSSFIRPDSVVGEVEELKKSSELEKWKKLWKCG